MRRTALPVAALVAVVLAAPAQAATVPALHLVHGKALDARGATAELVRASPRTLRPRGRGIRLPRGADEFGFELSPDGGREVLATAGDASGQASDPEGRGLRLQFASTRSNRDLGTVRLGSRHRTQKLKTLAWLRPDRLLAITDDSYLRAQVVDPRHRRVLRRIRLDPGPAEALAASAASGDRLVLVLQRKSGTRRIVVLDADGRVAHEAPCPIPGTPPDEDGDESEFLGALANPADGHVLLLDSAAPRIADLDPATGGVALRGFSLPRPGLTGLAWTLAGDASSLVAVASGPLPDVETFPIVLDARTLQVRSSFGLGASAYGVDAPATELAVDNKHESVRAFDLDGRVRWTSRLRHPYDQFFTGDRYAYSGGDTVSLATGRRVARYSTERADLLKPSRGRLFEVVD